MTGKAALIFVLGFSFLMGYTIMNLNTSGTRAVTNMSSYNGMTASHNVALAGANVGLAKLYRDTTWGSSGTATMTQTITSGPLKGSFTVTASKTGGLKTLRSASSCNFGGGTFHDTIEVLLSNNISNSFALFAWMTNLENGVYWITGDDVWGLVHSNDNLYVSGSPRFHRKVTTAKGFIPALGKTKNGHTNNAIFENPPQPETGVARIDLPNDLSEIATSAARTKAGSPTDWGKKYPFDIWVTLDAKTSSSGDGKAYIRKSATGAIYDSISLSETGFNGVVQSTGVVHIAGKLDGKLTLASYSTNGASNNDLYVDGDVLYEDKTGTSNDMLGLVANNDVIVTDNVAAGAGRKIDGSVFARTGSFTAQNYSTRSADGNLTVFGSIVQNSRGAVGTFTTVGGIPVLSTGFLKQYTYDDRLLNPALRPPHYPGWVRRTYAILNWWESYYLIDLKD